MMIGLSTLTYDLNGAIVLNANPDTTAQVYERRNSKNATLDGLSTISDMGYTASDNVFQVRCKDLAADKIEQLIYLVKSYPLLYYANSDGVFLGALNTLRVNVNPVEFIFQVKEQIA
jgi:hypothetical protein